MEIFGQGGGGGGGGGSQHTPVEAADSLQSMASGRMLIMLGHGETLGPRDKVNPLKSLYIDGTPVQNADGSFNFSNLQVAFRKGTQTQQPIPGFPDVETEISVNLQVKASQPITQTISDVNSTSVRVTLSLPNGLRATDPNNGDTSGSSVTMAIDLAPQNSPFYQVATVPFSGKQSGRYQKSVLINLAGAGPWQVRVRRLTPDSTSQYLVNQTAWDSFTSIIDAKLSYPNMALVGIKFDARQFQQVPKITVLWDQLLLQVPSNYDPVSRTYSGQWDGSFKPAFSSNPVWYLWTYCTDPRFGISILPENMDKWGLYTIAQWCDQLVPDGYGGYEPRFQYHNFQQDTADAWKVIADIVSCFSAQAYWSAGGVRVSADMPGTFPVKHFTSANVIDGRFVYSSTALNTRYTACSVSYVDPNNGYLRSLEYVDHDQGLQAYGLQQTDAIAVGAISRGQARRLGRYVLETAQRETELISFKAAAYAADLMPGDLFTTYDFRTQGRRMGGRLVSVSGAHVQLDASVTLDNGVSYTLECPMPDGSLQRRGVANPVGVTDALTLVAPFTSTPVTGTTWGLIGTNLAPDIWRCTGVKETAENEFEISGVQHDQTKWDAIESNIVLGKAQTSLLPTFSAPPSSLVLHEELYVTDRLRSKLVASWIPDQFAREHYVQYRAQNGNWHTVSSWSGSTFEVLDVTPGSYDFSVASVSYTNQRSMPATAMFTAQGLAVPPPDVQDVSTGFVAGITQLRWSAVSDKRQPAIDYEIRVGASWGAAQLVGRTSDTKISAIGDGVYWIAARYVLNGATNVYSTNPIEVVIAGATLSQNVVATFEQASLGWPGVVTGGAMLIGNYLMLQGAGDLLTDADFLGTSDVLWYGGVAPSGGYDIKEIVNVGRVVPCMVKITYVARGQSIYDNTLNIPDFLNASDLLGVAIGARITVQPQIAIAGSDGVFGAWQNHVPSVYNAQSFKARLLLSTSDPTVMPVVTTATFEVDVPDRTDNYQVATGSAPVSIAYSSVFNGGPNAMPSPAIQATILNAKPGDDVVIADQTLSGCSVQVINGGATAIRSVCLQVQGY